MSPRDILESLQKLADKAPQNQQNLNKSNSIEVGGQNTQNLWGGFVPVRKNDLSEMRQNADLEEPDFVTPI